MRRIRSRLDRWFPVGTRSLLFGAHCVFIHPIFVAIAWIRLYGWTWNPAIWLSFVVHDWGYWGKTRMDDEEGEKHVLLGARIVSWIFDRPRVLVFREIDGVHGVVCARVREWRHRNRAWFDFCAYHSRYWAKKDGRPFSQLCVADKLATAMEPAWLYLPRVILSGEIREYVAKAGGQPGSKYNGEPRRTDPAELEGLHSYVAWHRRMRKYLLDWAYAHRDGGEDTWTPAPAKGAA